MVVGVLVVIGADRVGAGWQIVERNGNRPGARPDLPHGIALIAVEELAGGRVKTDEDIALRAVQTIDRDDDARGGSRSRNKDQREGKRNETAATTPAAVCSL